MSAEPDRWPVRLSAADLAHLKQIAKAADTTPRNALRQLLEQINQENTVSTVTFTDDASLLRATNVREPERHDLELAWAIIVGENSIAEAHAYLQENTDVDLLQDVRDAQLGWAPGTDRAEALAVLARVRVVIEEVVASGSDQPLSDACDALGL